MESTSQPSPLAGIIKTEDEKRFLLESVNQFQQEIKRSSHDISVSELTSLYREGDLVINPDFQRLFRWDPERKTKFIESILVDIPIPPIFAVVESTRWVLVDGLQRLSTLIGFIGELNPENQLARDNDDSDEAEDSTDQNKKKDNKWELSEGSMIPELDGFTFEELPRELKFKIRRAFLRVELLTPISGKQDFRYELFSRLNTGGANLKDQEIRNAIYRGSFDDFYYLVDRLAENPVFKRFTNLKKQQLKELYDRELVLRFAALRDLGSIERYTDRALSKYMTDFLKEVVQVRKTIPAGLESDFTRLLNLLEHSKVEQPFRSKIDRFKSGLFDCVLLGLLPYLEGYEDLPAEQVAEKVETFKRVYDESQLSRYGTGSPTSVRKRIGLARQHFAIQHG